MRELKNDFGILELGNWEISLIQSNSPIPKFPNSKIPKLNK